MKELKELQELKVLKEGAAGDYPNHQSKGLMTGYVVTLCQRALDGLVCVDARGTSLN